MEAGTDFGDRQEMSSGWNMLIFVELKRWLMHPVKKEICDILSIEIKNAF